MRTAELLVMRGAQVNVDPSTEEYGETLLTACVGFGYGRGKIINLSRKVPLCLVLK
jgi:hypothetical protein